MKVFLDFEASSLAKASYPIEVAWIFENGRAETHLIRPLPAWTDWDEKAAALHGITRDMLIREGERHDRVAQRMIETLEDHDLYASAPSWDGKWLSTLLRAAGYPRHSLRLSRSDEAVRQHAETVLQDVVPQGRLAALVHESLAQVQEQGSSPPVHRALPDARADRERWLAAGIAALEIAIRESRGA